MNKIRDYVGNELDIGDEVIFTQFGMNGLCHGIIYEIIPLKFTPTLGVKTPMGAITGIDPFDCVLNRRNQRNNCSPESHPENHQGCWFENERY